MNKNLPIIGDISLVQTQIKMSISQELCIALKEFYKNPNFWGRIDNKTAESILDDQPDGSYLLKDCEEKEDEKKCLLELAVKIKSQISYLQINLMHNFKNNSTSLCVHFENCAC